jgi:hypothetical protein
MNKIKESFDNLPIAVCFFDTNGVVRLVNHRMLTIAGLLQKDGVQTLAEMESALKSPPEGISCMNPQLQIYRFPGGKALRFAQEQITTKAGLRYTQVTAADVTDLMRRQAEFNEENAKLAEANDRLRRLFEQMPEIVREEETLQMKLRVHDDIGHSILVSRRALLRQAGLEEIQASAAQWEQSIAVLYRSNQMRAESDLWGTTIGKAGEMGVRVLTEGKVPDAPGIRSLAILAITECAANCVRHADGTELYVRFGQSGGYTELALTNNGTPPQEKIREGGGLSMLRHRIEEAGGHMEIQSFPCFKLMINLPQEEAASYESNDC